MVGAPANPSVPLAQDLRAVLPIGIPLGWQPRINGQEPRFAVRRGGHFCFLDEEGQHLWAAAWLGPTRQEVIDVIAAVWKKDSAQVARDLAQFLTGRLLAQLGGDWHEDWDRIATLRVIPRTFVLDCDTQYRFRLVSGDGRWEVQLRKADYAIWSCWDGSTELEKAVAKAAEGTGLPHSMLKQRAHSLLVAAVRIKAVFLDDTAPKEI